MTAKATQMDTRTIPDHMTNVLFVKAEVAHNGDPIPKNSVSLCFVIEFQLVSLQVLAVFPVLSASVSVVQVLSDLLQRVQGTQELPNARRLNTDSF